MKWTRRSVIELTAILAMTAVVFVLAILQYRWTGTISRAEEARLKATLDTSVRNFNQEFSYDFERLCETFVTDPEAPESTLDSRVMRQYVAWVSSAVHPGLVQNVYLYLWKPEETSGDSVKWLNDETEKVQEVAWPARLQGLHKVLRRQIQQLPPAIDDRQASYYPWTVYEETPALVRPLFQIDRPDNEDEIGAQPIGFIVVEIDQTFLEQSYFPQLVNGYFGTSGNRSFEVAVRSASTPYQVVYASEANFPVETSSPDATVDLFDLVGEAAKRRGYPSLGPSEDGRQWELVVQNPAGSLQVGVAGWRRRNLAASFGLLTLLAVSGGLIFSVARRAERLARMQMEFVAGVSHELCTPLAVINSAAENLADGVVDEPRQAQAYGEMIRDQGRRLERLVDEVLLFAAGRSGRGGYDLRPVELASIVARSVGVSELMLQDEGFTLEKEISGNLPLVVADPIAVSSCIENLVNNAIKYAGPDRWIAVRTRTAPAVPHPEVEVIVEDRGIGIAPGDLPHIFEPFFRVQAVRDGQIRGVGLGLFLVKQMMEGMGGRVSVSSQPGRGSRFTLHFPAGDLTAQPRGEAEAA